MIEAVYAFLIADATLMAILTGGLWNALTVGEISRQNTPGAFNGGGEILPCGLIKDETITPWGPNLNSARSYFVIYLYQNFSYAQIDLARKRIYTLLHRNKVVPTDGTGLYQILHGNDVLGQEDTALNTNLQLSRFYATVQR